MEKKKIVLTVGGTILATAALAVGATASFAGGESPLQAPPPVLRYGAMKNMLLPQTR